MDLILYLSIGLQIIGGATVLFRIMAPLTKWKGDDKILSALELILSKMALNKNDSKLEIKLK